MKQLLEDQEKALARIERITRNANQAIDALSASTKVMAEKTEHLDKVTAKAGAETARLHDLHKFLRLSMEAYNDDRPAFDELQEWSRDSANSFAQEAGEVCWKVVQIHSKPHYFMDFDDSWIEDELKYEKYQKMPSKDAIREKFHWTTPPFRPAIIKYVWMADRVPMEEKIEFSKWVMNIDSSLTAVEYAAKFLADHLGMPIKPLMLLDSLNGRGPILRQNLPKKE